MPVSLTRAEVAESPFDFVDPDSLLGRAAGLWAYVPANGAAFLMQAMHPTIGDVVGKYSVYRSDPFGRAIRSIDSVNLWVYGDAAAIEEGYRLRRLHQPLQMINDEGKRIGALNPEPYGWVLATGYASSVWMWPYLFGRALTTAEEERVFVDMRKVARILQVPNGYFPATRGEFWRYFDEMVSTTLVNHPVAQDIIRNQLLRSPHRPRVVPAALKPLWWPAGAAIGRSLYLLTIGLLPPAVRAILDVEWSAREVAAAAALWASIRVSHKYLPDRVKYTPVAYHSIRRARAIDAIKQRALTSFA